MTRSLVAIITMAVIVVGCAGSASPSGAAVAATTATRTPRASTVPSIPDASVQATTSIPEALKYVWLGPAREIAGLGGPQALTIMRIRGDDPATLDVIVGGHGEEALNSTVTVPAPGRVRLTSHAAAGCDAGDEGTYEWTTTTDPTGLTMTKVAEACASREEALVGDWVRSACKDFGCLGDLEAGTHETAFFEPLGDPTAFTGSWRMQYGGLSYTVPSGWANAVDDPNFYDIVPQAEYANSVTDLTVYPGIALFPDEHVAAQDQVCSPKDEPGVGPSSAAIASRIAQIPNLEVGAATPITIGGLSGTMLDLAVNEGRSSVCAANGGVPVLRSGGEATDGQGGWARRITAGERWRLILLDVAKGRTMAVVISDASVPSRFDDLVAQAMPIVTSFEFHQPAP